MEAKLRQLETQVEAWRKRVKDQNERKTYDEVFDHATLRVLQRLISQRIIETLDYPVATGKEGNVFRATTRQGVGNGSVAARINGPRVASALNFADIARPMLPPEIAYDLRSRFSLALMARRTAS